MASAARVPNTPATLLRPMGPTDCLAPWIDRSYHLLLLQLRLGRVWRTRRPADLLGGERRCTRHPRAIVTFARHHQLPGDAGNLVGECHGRMFRRLTLQQREQPGRPAAVLGL